MSSDTSVVTVLRVAGSLIDLRVRTTLAGGLSDYGCTRSFALLLLADARRRSAEYGSAESSRDTPLEQEVRRWEAAETDWYQSAAFMRAHLAEYIRRTAVRERHHVVDERDPAAGAALVAWLRETEAMHLPPRAMEDRLCERLHYVVLRVAVTESRWLDGLEPGMVFGTTAYDVWWDDPRRERVR